MLLHKSDQGIHASCGVLPMSLCCGLGKIENGIFGMSMLSDPEKS